MSAPLFDRLLVVGLGLIGSSLARRAVADPAIAREVVACDEDPAVRARVAELGIVHRVASDAPGAARDARPRRIFPGAPPAC